MLIEEDLNADFTVGNPEEKGSHIQYFVQGKDRQGAWQGMRRYNHFFLLSEVLQQRWTAINLPRLPPKKAIGRYETKFLQERRYFLERFLRKCGNYDFIINSEEFLVFARPNGDVEKVLQRMTKLSASTLIERYHRGLDINERRYDANEKGKLNNAIGDFFGFANRSLLQMKDLKHKLRALKDTKAQSILHNKVLFKVLENYEGENGLCYEDGLPEKLILTSAKNNPETA